MNNKTRRKKYKQHVQKTKKQPKLKLSLLSNEMGAISSSSLSNRFRLKTPSPLTCRNQRTPVNKKNSLHTRKDRVKIINRCQTPNTLLNRIDFGNSFLKNNGSSLFNKKGRKPETCRNNKNSLFQSNLYLTKRDKKNKKWLSHIDLKKKVNKKDLENSPTLANSEVLPFNKTTTKVKERLLNDFSQEERVDLFQKKEVESIEYSEEEETDFNFFKKVAECEIVSLEDEEEIDFFRDDKKKENKRKKSGLYSSYISKANGCGRRATMTEKKKNNKTFKNRYSFLMSANKNKS